MDGTRHDAARSKPGQATFLSGWTRHEIAPTLDLLTGQAGVAMLVARLVGELDLLSVPALEPVLDQQVARSHPCRLVLDLSRTRLLSACGVTFLVRQRQRSRAEHRHLVLVGASHRSVQRPLQITGELPLFDLTPSLGHALTGARAAAYSTRDGKGTNRN